MKVELNSTARERGKSNDQVSDNTRSNNSKTQRISSPQQTTTALLDTQSGCPQLIGRTKLKMNQLSPKMIDETPNGKLKSPNKDTENDQQENLNHLIYQKLFRKFTNGQESPPRTSSMSPRKTFDIQEVLKLRQELHDKYDRHVQNKRRNSQMTQDIKQQLHSKTERKPTQIVTQEEPSIGLEQQRLSKSDLKEFIARQERSQERKMSNLTKTASEQAVEAQWKMSPKSKLIISRSMDKEAFQDAYSPRKQKPLFETNNFTPKVKENELKQQNSASERLFNQALIQQNRDEVRKFEIEQVQQSIREVVKRAPKTQSMLAEKIRKSVRKVFEHHFDTISTQDNLVDLVMMLKLVGAVPNQTVSRYLIPNHPNLQFNLETLILTILDLNENDTATQQTIKITKLLQDDRVLTSGKLICQPEELYFTQSQQKIIQQHFVEFSQHLRKKSLQANQSQTTFGSPKSSRQYNYASAAQISPIRMSSQTKGDFITQNDTSNVFKQKRDNYLNQMIMSSKIIDQDQVFLQKRLTQHEVQSSSTQLGQTMKAQKSTRTTPSSQLQVRSPDRPSTQLIQKRKSLQSINQKSRNNPNIYSIETENQLKTLQTARNQSAKRKLDIQPQPQKEPIPKRASLKHTPRRLPEKQTEKLQPTIFKAYDPAVAVAAQMMKQKTEKLASGRSSKMSTKAFTKDQPLTSRKKAPVLTIINLQSDQRAPVQVEQFQVKTIEEVIAPTSSALNLTDQSGQDQVNLDLNLNFTGTLRVEEQVVQVLESQTINLSVEKTPAVEQPLRNTILSDSKPSNQQSQSERFSTFGYSQQQIDTEIEAQQRQLDYPNQRVDNIAVQQELHVQDPLQTAHSASLISQNQGQQMEEQGAKDYENSVSEIKEQTNEQKSLIEFDQQHFEQEQILNTKQELQVIQDHGSEISRKSQNFMSEEESQIEIAQMQNNTNHQMGPDEDQQQFILNTPITIEFNVEKTVGRLSEQKIAKVEKQDNQTKIDEQVVFIQKDQVEDVKQLQNLSQEAVERQYLSDSIDQELREPEQDKKLSRQSSEKQSAQSSHNQQPDNLIQVNTAQEEEQNSISKIVAQQDEIISEQKQSPKSQEDGLDQLEMNQKVDEKLQDIDPIETLNQNLQSEQNTDKIIPDTLRITLDADISNENRHQELVTFAQRPSQCQHAEQNQPVTEVSFAKDQNSRSSEQLEEEISAQVFDQNAVEQAPRDSKSIKVDVTALTDRLSTDGRYSPDRLIETTRKLSDVFQQNLQEITLPVQESALNKQPFSDKVLEQIDHNQRDVEVDTPNTFQQQPLSRHSSKTELVQQPLEEQKADNKIDSEQQKPKESIQSQLQNIKQGFYNFMNRKQSHDEQPDQTEKPKEDEKILPSKVVGQLGEFLNKVQENVKQHKVSDTLQNVGLPNSISNALQSLQDKIQEKLPNEMIQSIQEQLPKALVQQVTESLSKPIQNTVQGPEKSNNQENSLVGNLLNIVKEKAEAKIQQSGLKDYLSSSKQPSSNVSLSPILEEGPEDLSPQKLELPEPPKDDTTYIDKMATVLDKLDKEYEEELKSKPKLVYARRQTEQKTPQVTPNNQPLKRKSTNQSSSKRSSSGKQGYPTSLPVKKQSKTVTQEQPKPQKIVTPNKITPQGKTKTPQDAKNQAKKAPLRYSFPAEVVDAPEIMFFLPSWFQFTGSKKKK